jgi:hypothetical protein
MSTFAIHRLWCGLTARYHVWHGRRAYRAGRLRAAGRHLDRALSRGYSSFGAYLLSGKVAYRERDMQRAMDCFRMARRSDPARYALEGFPKGFIESLATHPSGKLKQRYRIIIEPGLSSPATPSAGYRNGPEPLRPRPRPEMRGGSAPKPPHEAPSQGLGGIEASQEESGTGTGLGDFTTPAERERTRSRPLLRPGEWADIDWDLEARKLFGE